MGDMMDGFFTNDERRQLFDDVILPGDVKLTNPDPEIFKLALDRLVVKASEAIFIDDSERHTQGAEQLVSRAFNSHQISSSSRSY